MMHPKWFVALALVTALLPACKDKGSVSSASAAPAAPPAAPPAPAAGALQGICPDPIVIQIDWFATPERAAAFQLVGPGGAIDKKKGTYSGPLAGTGVSVQ